MKKHYLIMTLALLLIQLMAGAQPNIRYGNNAEYSIHWKNNIGQLNQLTPEIKIDGNWVSANEFSSIKWVKKEGSRLSEVNKYTGNVEMLYLVCEGHPLIDNFTIAFELMEGRPYLVMNSQLKAAKDFSLGGVRLFSSPKENIVLPGESKDWMIFTESAAGPHTGSIMYPHMLNTKVIERGKYSKANTGIWLSMLVNNKENYSFSFASISAELWPNNFKWELPEEGDFNKLKLSARSGAIYEKEEILVQAGKQITTDAFLLGFWDNERPTKILLETGVIMGENIRKGKPMRCPQPGWSSWHSYGRSITEKGVLNAADFMAKDLSVSGWKTIQIDGGWWQEQGLYYLKDEFPNGIRYLSNYTSNKKLDFGLHISPLRVNTKDPVFITNPSCILQPFIKKKIDLNDDEMVTTIGASYVDGSHPYVPPFLAGRFQQMIEGYQPVFMKWDHHYGALAEGKRYNKTMTSLQAHNKTIRAIRGALPKDLIVTRSMGYLLGALECYDAIRVGNDINHPGVISDEEPYADITFGKTLGTIEDEQTGKGLIRFARSASQNYYIHKNIAICDPDAFFVTPQYTINEAKCHMTLQAIMGGLFFVGDRIESLPEERVEMLKNKEIMAINKLGVHAIPLDLFTGVDIPTIWKIETKERLIIAIFNWMDEECTKTYDYKTDFELDGKNYQLKELWTNKTLKSGNNKIKLSQSAHSVHLIEFLR